ncbi:MAG: DUF3313 family protein [Candidatus Omnitrophota bacterium]
MKPYYFFLGLLLSGCASTLETSGFLQNASVMSEGAFFKQEYFPAGEDLSGYASVQVRSADLSYLKDASEHTRSDLVKVAGELSRSLEEGLSKAGFQVLPASEKPGPGTLVVSPALVSLGTPERTLNAVTSVLIWTPVTVGSAGFAAKLLDGESGALLGEIAEKNKGGSGGAKSLTVGAYTKYTHAEAAFDTWGGRLAEMLRARGMRAGRSEAA